MTAHKQAPNFGFGSPTANEQTEALKEALAFIKTKDEQDVRMVAAGLRSHGAETHLETFLQWAKRNGIGRYKAKHLWQRTKPDPDAIEEVFERHAEARQKKQRFAPQTAASLEVMTGQQWRIKGVLPAEGIAAVYGPSASGKSFLALEAAAAIAEGRAFFGHTTKPAPVLYVGLEGEGGYRGRTLAWERHHGRPMPDNAGFLLAPFRLTSPQDVADLAAVCPQGCVVFIDTLNRAAPGMDENSSRDMSNVIEGAKQLQRQIGGLVVLIAHTGKDATKGLRGHSSLFAALDAAILVSRDGDVRSWQLDKAKDGKDGVEHRFKLQVVSLGTDEDGDELTSCVVEPNESPQVPGRNRPLTANQQLGMDTFNEAIKSVSGIEGGGVFDGLHVELWRDVFYRRCPADSKDAKQKAFQRARADLTANGFLIVDSDVYKLGKACADLAAMRLASALRQ